MENSFLCKFGQKGFQMGNFAFFENFVICFSLKKRQNGSSFNSLFFVRNLIPDKILVLELLAKMFLTNQIAGFFKV